MKSPSRQFNLIVLGAAMVAAACMAVVVKPSRLLADTKPPVNLERIMPTSFGDWQEDTHMVAQQVNPEMRAAIDKIYTQVLNRTYVNSHGYRIMLTVPYGKKQSDGLSAHDPEGCYPSQGFKILTKSKTVVSTALGNIPVRRMEAANGPRYEPVTYWFMVGDQAVNNDIDRKRAQFMYALRGDIPDGLLFRISSIDGDAQRAYGLQSEFINDLMQHASLEARKTLAGLGV